jgi:hypothetical protein
MVTLVRCQYQDWVGVERRARPGYGDDATHGCGVVRIVVQNETELCLKTGMARHYANCSRW